MTMFNPPVPDNPDFISLVKTELAEADLRIKEILKEKIEPRTGPTEVEKFWASLERLKERRKLLNQELTVREKWICWLAYFGQNDEQISDYLNLSSNTVKSYWKKIFKKLGLNSRSKVVAVLFRKNEFDKPPESY